MTKILDHPNRILIIGGFGSEKTNALLNLISHQPDIDKIYLFARDPYEAKCQLLINKRKVAGIKRILIIMKLLLKNEMILIIFVKNIEEYNQNKKRNILIIFDDMITDMLSIKKNESNSSEIIN